MKARDFALVLLAVVIAAMIPDSLLPMLASDVWADALGAPPARQNAAPVGTAFTYQGQLMDGGAPADGIYDLRFILYNAEVGGSQIGPIVYKNSTVVSGGLFSVELDFGASAFAGEARWLEIGVGPGGSGTYTVLSDRQKVTPTPNALYASNADTVDGQHASAFMAAGADNWVNTSGDTMTGALTIDRTAPIVYFRENDQSLPNGLWRIAVDGQDWRIDENTSAVGDFATSIKPLFLEHGGYVGINTMDPERQLDVNGGALVRGGIESRSSTPSVYLSDSTGIDDNYSAYVNNGNLYIWWDRGDDGVWDSPNPLVLTGLNASFGGDVTVAGDLAVNGAACGFLPAPAWESGWIGTWTLPQLLIHNLGGDVGDYVVDMMCKDAGVDPYGINNMRQGLDFDATGQRGVWYQNLTTMSIYLDAIYELAGLHECEWVDVRIWLHE
jgi:hypothetical protein